MNGASRPLPGPPGDLRQGVIDRLCEAFAEDRISMEEFERRVDAVHGGASETELRSLLADLPALTPPVQSAPRAHSGGASDALVAPTRTRHPTIASETVREQSVVMGLLGGTRRTGAWVPARTNWVVGVMGGAELDFREAPMPPGVTEVRVVAFWGGVDIVVPPDVRIECSGVGILGGFDEAHTAECTTSPEAPVLRVSGLALMGGVSIAVRNPGESAGDARRRRRLERKARKRLRTGRP